MKKIEIYFLRSLLRSFRTVESILQGVRFISSTEALTWAPCYVSCRFFFLFVSFYENNFKILKHKLFSKVYLRTRECQGSSINECIFLLKAAHALSLEVLDLSISAFVCLFVCFCLKN